MDGRAGLAGWLFVLCLCCCAFGCSGASLDLGIPKAERGTEPGEGLSWWSRAAMDATLRYSVWSGGRSGFVAAFARDGHPVHATAVGWADIEGQVPMTLETRMRFASMTKPIIAVAALILIEEGRLGLDDPVERYIPAFTNARVATSHTRNAEGTFDTVPANPIPSVRHLLTFSSGVGPGMEGPSDLVEHWEDNGLRSIEVGSLAERVDRVAGLPLFEQPGEKWRYGGSADVLARVVEVASGEPLDVFLQRRILGPLGMTSTRYARLGDDGEVLARVYTQDASGALVRAKPRDALGWTPGGTGLISTAGDYMRFALMLWNRGEYDGARILRAETVDEMAKPHVPSGVRPSPDIDGLGWGLGLSVVVDADATPFTDRNGDFWWAGAYSTTCFVSPESGLVGVILSQNTFSEYSDLPIALYAAQAFAFAGL